MDSKVIVLADETTKAVVSVSTNNPEYGYVRVQQMRTVVDDNGFLRRKNVSALIPGTVAELTETGFYAGQQIEGRIIIEESMTPFNEKQPEKDLKIAGETGIVCKLGGLPIYRRTKFTFDETAKDVTIKHDNVDELRAAYNSQKKGAVQPNADFNIGG